MLAHLLYELYCTDISATVDRFARLITFALSIGLWAGILWVLLR